jgi:diguanylate cyclase (GGDEF)-like protein/PAS domain S-box-containing protein
MPEPMPLGSWRVLSLILAATAVVLAAVYVVDSARVDADRARQAQAELQRLSAMTARLDVITWRALGTQRGTAPDTAVAGGVEAYRRIAVSLRTLRRLGVPRHRIAAIEEPLGAIYGLGVQSIVAARKSPAASREIATRRFSPAIDRLDDLIAAQSAVQDDKAASAAHQARAALIVSVVIALALLVLLAARIHRIRRRAAVEDQARADERHLERRVHALMRHSSDVVAVIDTGARVRFIAESVERMLGYDPADLVDAQLTSFVHPDEAHRAIAALRDLAGGSGRSTGTVSLRVRASDGQYRDLEVIAENHLDDPDIAGVLMNLRDVTERRELEQRLRHQAFHDGLTGLANRELFEDRLSHALVRMRRHGDRTAVIFIDLDDFKTVNDSLGHAVGDELLRTAALRIQTALRAQDTAARFGGDEFAVLLEDLDGEDAADVAERIRQALVVPVELGDRRIAPSASFGIAYPDPATSATELIGNADVAMYAAKERGKGQAAAFEPEMRERVVERMDLTGDLTVALERDELFLEYQPSSSTNRSSSSTPARSPAPRRSSAGSTRRRAASRRTASSAWPSRPA